jgi:hypothetical protein
MSLRVILLAAVVIIGGYLVYAYNALIKNKNLVAEGWSGIDVQLRRRADLIPNLVETVKGYAAHEDKLFRDIAELRAKSISGGTVSEQSQVSQAMTSMLGRLFAIAEAYPELKADANALAVGDRQHSVGLVVPVSLDAQDLKAHDIGQVVAVLVPGGEIAIDATLDLVAFRDDGNRLFHGQSRIGVDRDLAGE